MLYDLKYLSGSDDANSIRLLSTVVEGMLYRQTLYMFARTEGYSLVINAKPIWCKGNS